MAQNGKNESAIFTILRVLQIDVKEDSGAKRRYPLLDLYSAFFSLRKSPRKFPQDSFSPLQAKSQTL